MFSKISTKFFLTAGLTFALALGSTQTGFSASNAWKKCGYGKRITCVVDGDTIWFRGEKIRLVGFDTPEAGKSARCSKEKKLAQKATEHLVDLLNDADLQLERIGVDRFDRTLGKLYIDGKNVADLMISAGHATIYTPKLHRSNHWCLR